MSRLRIRASEEMLNRKVAAMTESSRNLRSWFAWPA